MSINENTGETPETNQEPEIVVNEYTPDTVVIEMETPIEMPPANRPRKVYKGMWGNPEIAAFGVSLLVLFSVFALYLFFVVPSNNGLEEAKADRDRLEAERKEAQAKYGGITSTQKAVEDLLSSVDSFESNYLPVESTGKTSLYQRMNSLIAGYGLVNTSGPDFAPLETLAVNTNGNTREGDAESGRARFQSLFPGVYVTTTVEGSYQNVRRFIREIETGNEFVLISSVELEPSESRQRRDQPDPQPDQAQPIDPTRGGGFPPGFGRPSFSQPQQRPQDKGRTQGEVVSLRLEMAAYFRRPNMTTALPEGGTQ